jgi:hypothetical protein
VSGGSCPRAQTQNVFVVVKLPQNEALLTSAIDASANTPHRNRVDDDGLFQFAEANNCKLCVLNSLFVLEEKLFDH